MLAAAWKIPKYFPFVSSSPPIVKSERINSLRKQYDAFLEDDKKRKERNEYILEKLDKMRYCTAMVQVRQKAPFLTESRRISINNTPEQAFESPTVVSPVNIDISTQRVDESVLLQEISKKYILIPKLRPTYIHEYTNQVKPKIDDNTDWKSKYDILDQLKRDEKEQDSPMRHESGVHELNLNESKIFVKENDTIQGDEPALEYKNELPVKLSPGDQTSYELQNYPKDNAVDQNYHYNAPVDDAPQNNGIDALYCKNDLHNVAYDENIQQTNAPVYGDHNVKNTIYDQNHHNDIDKVDLHRENTDNIVYDNTIQPQDIYDNTVYDQIPTKDVVESKTPDLNAEKLGESAKLFDTAENTTADSPKDYYAPIDNQNDIGQGDIINLTQSPINQEEFGFKEEENNNTIDPIYQTNVDQHGSVQEPIDSDLIHEIDKEMPEENNATVIGQDFDYPIETVNVQDFTPRDDVQLVDGQNINPEPYVLSGSNDLTNQFDPVIDPNNQNIPTETFNTEQNEGYYSEQQEPYDYTEEALVENYNTDYTAPTENYQQNADYAYYEGTQPEQPFAEINENEDITQQYDQNYEQQYGTAYDQQAYQQQGYEQEYPQEYTDPNQQYEGQQDLPYEQQDNLTPQFVEQQLDNEAGYVVATSETTEQSGVDNIIGTGTEQASPVVDTEAKVQ